MDRSMRAPVLFLWTQSVAITGWWSMLWLGPRTRPAFTVSGWPEETLLSFALPSRAKLRRRTTSR